MCVCVCVCAVDHITDMTNMIQPPESRAQKETGKVCLGGVTTLTSRVMRMRSLPSRYGLGLCKSAAPDSRSTSSGCARSVPPHHTTSPSLQEDSITMEINNCHEEEEEEVPLKRPRLLEDMRLSPHGSTDSVSSEPLHPMDPAAGPDSPSQPTGSPQVKVDGLLLDHCNVPLHSQGPGLSAYLEDIDSDEGDLLMVDEDDKAPGTPLPETTPPPPPAPLVSGSGLPTKEQLLQKMETVDRDIAATEGQIVALQKRLAELEGSIHSTPSTSSPLHPSPLPLSSSTDVEEGTEEEGVSAPPTPRDERRGSPKRSLPDSVYSENKVQSCTCIYALLLQRVPCTWYAMYKCTCTTVWVGRSSRQV